jgi:hypothetical protein
MPCDLLPTYVLSGARAARALGTVARSGHGDDDFDRLDPF